jgi:hypothetical protein
MVFENVNLMPGQGDTKLMLVQPVLNFLVPFVPTQLSFVVLGAISHFDRAKKYLVEIKIVNTALNEVANKISWEVIEQPDDENIPPSGMLVADIKNMIVKSEGKYNIELYVDGEKIGEQFFDIYKKKDVNGNA